MYTILLLGSGELGKEFVISAKRLGLNVIACDSYKNAPAMQVADKSFVFNMLNADKLREIITKTNPDIIVPEVEAIRTEVLLEAEKKGFKVAPSSNAVNLTMNRDRIRDRAVKLGIKTAKFYYASSLLDITDNIHKVGFPCILKPVMSSSGKGQSLISSIKDIENAWNSAQENMRGDRDKVIIESFVEFESEITLLTVKQSNLPTLFCSPIGHIQNNGDYQESWQPHNIKKSLLKKAQKISKMITDDLGGEGLFGVEFFVCKKEIIFSELSPRPHDTGMVTMYTQNLNQFELHLRAIMNYPIPSIKLLKEGYSKVIQAGRNVMPKSKYSIDGISEALAIKDVDIRVFGKPYAHKNRRLGVILAKNKNLARKAIKLIKINIF